MQHLVLYDGECGVCDHAVQWVLRHDTQEIFAFAPLQGTTATELLAHFPQEIRAIDSIFLIENFRSQKPQVYWRGKAIFGICWLLQGSWRCVGWPFFLPAWLYDWAYRLVAKWRYQLVPQRCLLPTKEQKKRFLP